MQTEWKKECSSAVKAEAEKHTDRYSQIMGFAAVSVLAVLAAVCSMFSVQ